MLQKPFFLTFLIFALRSKTLQKSRHVAMGRKKFNMDPKKVKLYLYMSTLSTLSSLFVSCVVMDSFPSLQGIVFLVENELLRHTSEDIAQFLYKGEGLNKTAIGDYLGERCLALKYPLVVFLLLYQPFVTVNPLLLFCRDDFNIKVLQAFVDLHEFTDLNLVQALR